VCAPNLDALLVPLVAANAAKPNHQSPSEGIQFPPDSMQPTRHAFPVHWGCMPCPPVTRVNTASTFAQRAALRQHRPRSHEWIVSGARPDSRRALARVPRRCRELAYSLCQRPPVPGEACDTQTRARDEAVQVASVARRACQSVEGGALRVCTCRGTLDLTPALHGACPCARHARRHGATQRRLSLARCDAAQPATSVSTLLLQALSRRGPTASAFASRPAHARRPVGRAEAAVRAAGCDAPGAC